MNIVFYLPYIRFAHTEVAKNNIHAKLLCEISNRMLSMLQEELRKLKNPAKAKVLAGFFKTGKGQYGEGDKFLGIVVPRIRLTIKKYQNLSLDDIGNVLQSEFHEERLAAALILVSQFENGNEKRQKEVFDFYLKNIGKINNWDLVDSSASQIVGAYFAGKPKDILFELVKSKSLWSRRVAMVSTFHEIKNGKSELALAVAEKLLDDKEDLMHKAVGWMLREVGKRCSLEKEEIFLEKHAATMPRTTLRYALEHFSEDKRRLYLNYKNKSLSSRTSCLLAGRDPGSRKSH